MELGQNELLAMYYLMALTRALENAVQICAQQGQIMGTIHTARGHEAATVGSAFALAKGDILAPQHRDLGALLARGITPREIMAQWLLRGNALAQGRDGELHLGDMRDRMILPATGLPGISLPVAVGTAMGAKLRGEKRVTLAYIGDGGSNTGSFHEALNLAATLDLPLICLIENNGYAHATPTSAQFRVKHLADRAAAYGIPGYVIDGNDVLAVYETTRQAVEFARAGRGPSLIEAKTFRVHGHNEADHADYVPAAKLAEWQQHDPLDRFTQYLMNSGSLTATSIAEFAEKIAQTVDDALTYARNSPAPDASTLTDHLFAAEDALPMGPRAQPNLVHAAIERKDAWN